MRSQHLDFKETRCFDTSLADILHAHDLQSLPGKRYLGSCIVLTITMVGRSLIEKADASCMNLGHVSITGGPLIEKADASLLNLRHVSLVGRSSLRAEFWPCMLVHASSGPVLIAAFKSILSKAFFQSIISISYKEQGGFQSQDTISTI